MAAAYPMSSPTESLRPHPYLREPLLYISNLSPTVHEVDLARALEHCKPFRPTIDRDISDQSMGSGTLEFRHMHNAEKALATLQSRPIPSTLPPALLSLSPFPPTVPPSPIPPPAAQPRLVKHLPHKFTDSELYDIFRPFGCLASVRTQAGFGPGTGVVEFCYEEEAQVAQEAMHCAEIQGQNIAVQVYQPRKGSGTYAEFSPNAPAFVPSSSVLPYDATPTTPPQHPHVHGTALSTFVHGPGQQVQLAPLSGPGSNSHSGLIDPCNLFIKNLDPDIDSNALFGHFHEFGQIVSARVMRNELGASRGFGFVSYQTRDQSAHAMHVMNGATLGSKQVIVRLHEPKQLRQEKLAQRFGGHSSHPRSSSGATSPTLSDGAESYGGWPSPGHAHPGLGSTSMPMERARRSSGSYYNAALAGTLNLPMRYEDLSALSPVVRKEVLSGELIRRIKHLNVSVDEHEVDSIVDSLVGLSLTEVIEGIQEPSKLEEQVHAAKQALFGGLKLPTPDKSSSNSPAPSQDSRLLDPQALIATASAPEHPSTPLSVSGSLSDPPRTSSPSGSIPATSDKERLLAAVAKLEAIRAQEITELLMTLSKRERALCLFSTEILKQKVAEAKEIVSLESEPKDEDTKANLQAPVSSVHENTNSSKPSSALPPKAPANIVSSVPPTEANPHTLASLARLPAVEIIDIASGSSISTGMPLPKPDDLVLRATDEFIDSLKDQSIPQQKQAVGEKLFKFVRAAGVGKAAGKITIHLLDTENLRALAHLMNSYPSVLKEKISAVSSLLAAST